jgi:hypothetical protein
MIEKKPSKISVSSYPVLIGFLMSLAVFPALLYGQAHLQIDLQGDHYYSHYNFTNLVPEYKHIDGWSEIKGSLWFQGSRICGFYLSALGIYTTEPDVFHWQKNAGFALGFQIYPLPYANQYLRALRIFIFRAFRWYWANKNNEEYQKDDFHIGADYYWDNLFSKIPLKFLIWFNMSVRESNWTEDDYWAFLSTGNLKAGYRLKPGPFLFLPYGVLEWTWVNKYKERWWENYVRGGAGIRVYYNTKDNKKGLINGLIKRFHIYAEFLGNIRYLGEKAPDVVKNTDFRIGLGYSTSGFYRER